MQLDQEPSGSDLWPVLTLGGETGPEMPETLPTLEWLSSRWLALLQ